MRNDPPAWLDLLGDIFPLKAFADSFFAAFDPFEEGSAYKPWLLLRIGLWGLAGALVAAGKAATLKEGVALAAESIDSGAAKDKLDALVELSQRL